MNPPHPRSLANPRARTRARTHVAHGAARRILGLRIGILSLLLAASMSACSRPERAVTLELADGGRIVIELRPDKAPKTVANFKRLAREGFYDGTTFHLAIPQFMIQGGDPNTKNDRMIDDGFGGPGYRIEDEFNDLPHVQGAVSMANTGQPNTAGSQFFIMVADTGAGGENWSEELDGKYTVFGKVVEGIDVIERIATTPTGDNEIPGQEYRPNQDQVIERVRIGR